MANVTIHTTLTLDGFMARPDDSLDWAFNYEADEMIAEIMGEIGAVVIGNGGRSAQTHCPTAASSRCLNLSSRITPATRLPEGGRPRHIPGHGFVAAGRHTDLREHVCGSGLPDGLLVGQAWGKSFGQAIRLHE